ncbi:hypothetical protein L208DRAFT_1483097 [Tricholoma matsutake]|nr:hypothetical protein L208DRAFT_1483097 [Tricholoma matsutake 945]
MVQNETLKRPVKLNPLNNILSGTKGPTGSNSRWAGWRASRACTWSHLYFGLWSHIIYIIILLSCFTLYTQAFLTPTNSFNVLAINTNGYGSAHGLKIQSVNNVIMARQPHAFVILETKTGSKVMNDLPYLDYAIHEATGVQ